MSRTALKCGLVIVTDRNAITRALLRAMEENGGVLVFTDPTIVQRTFCQQGEPFGLCPDQLYPYGPTLGQGDELWRASAMKAMNGEPGCPVDEGISYVTGIDDQGQEVAISFDLALDCFGQTLVGLERVKNWPYAKIFSNRYDIPNHFHLTEEDAISVGLEGSKWESYLLLEELMLRSLDSPRMFPAGLYEHIGPDDVAQFLLDKNWGQPKWDARALSPAHLVRPGQGAHMPPGVPHAPTGQTPFFELMEKRDHFIMISGFQDKIITPEGLRWRHLLAEQQGWDDKRKAEFVAHRIDYVASKKCFRRNNMLEPIPDTDNNGNGVRDGVSLRWGIYGMLGGQERYSAKLWRLEAGASVKLSGPPLVSWVLDGSISFGKKTLANSRVFGTQDRIFDLGLKTEGAEIILQNNGPAHASGVMWFGPNSHGNKMPSYFGQKN
mgnify:CR=1 FL=1